MGRICTLHESLTQKWISKFNGGGSAVLRVRFPCLFFSSIKAANRPSNLQTPEIYLSSSGGLGVQDKSTNKFEEVPPSRLQHFLCSHLEKGASEFSAAPSIRALQCDFFQHCPHSDSTPFWHDLPGDSFRYHSLRAGATRLFLFQLPITNLGFYLCFWLTGYKLKVPTTPSHVQLIF